MKLSILEYMRYLGGTENSKCIVAGENVLNAGHLILAGQIDRNDDYIQVYALCLQSTALNSDPHEIKGTLNTQNSITVRSMLCSCKAGNSGKCKHISAFLVKCVREDVESLENISPTDIKCVWSTQKEITRDKYKPVPVDEMPCLKDKVKKTVMAVDKEGILDCFCQSLPNSAIAKHRQGRREECDDGGSTSLESSQSRQNDYNQAILNHACQSACMMYLASVKIQEQETCCLELFSNIFQEDDGQIAINFQQRSTEWTKQRKYRVTGSRCYELFTYSKNEWDTKAVKYFYPNLLNNKYVKHGLKWEHRARDVFQKSTGAHIIECGMVISHSNKWLGYSPDGIIFLEGNPAYLLEIKCSFEDHPKTIDDEEQERDMLRQDRHKERARDRNLARAAPDKRSKLQRERERDISEQIALGMPARGVASNETQFDQRLFGQAQGLGQGYADDEAYNVYDKPWREGGSMANHIYRPSKNIDKEVYGGEELEKVIRTNRFVPDKEFGGTDRSGTGRAGPVQFEKEEDPFGLDQFLSQAKRASKRKEPEKRDDRDKRKRRD